MLVIGNDLIVLDLNFFGVQSQWLLFDRASAKSSKMHKEKKNIFTKDFILKL